MLTNFSPTDTTPVPTLDYENLRKEGIAWLEKLAGPEWTDFNAHDPGITILEQVCYALTDLSYRINYDMEDLLSREGEDTYDSLYSPQQILTSKPVTLLDLRKLVIDVEGVKNAWIEPVCDPTPPLYYREKQASEAGEKVIGLKLDEGASPLALHGVYRVLIEKSEAEALNKVGGAIVRDVAERLHAQRSLTIDFESIQVLDDQNVQLQTSIEIDTQADPEEVYLGILGKIAAYLSPSPCFYSLEECLAQGKPIEEIFDGPLLDHGFIDSQELIGLKRKKNLYASDLIREIMDVTGVRMVEYVVFKSGDKLNDATFVLDSAKTPKLDIDNSKVTLKKRQLPIQLNSETLVKRYFSNQQNALQRKLVSSSLPRPKGRDRHIERYYSLLLQFPKVYGIGAAGLPSTASEQRRAQAKQLKAYLLLFEQLLANSFSQLAHVKDLFSFRVEQPASYFVASLDDDNVGGLWVDPNNKSRGDSLQKIFAANLVDDTAAQADDWQRKTRFIDHLLARFAEQFTDYSSFFVPGASQKEPLSPEERLNEQEGFRTQVQLNKLALLRRYNQISSKGTGFNVLAPYGADNRSNLEQNLRLKLGILEDGNEKLFVVEHALLRPMTGDIPQQSSLLSNARSSDPYSLQLSMVLFAADFRSADFKHLVEQIVRDETPAHLIVYIRMDLKDAAYFDATYKHWQQTHLAYRILSDQGILNGSIAQSAAISLRDARDRLIDLLGIATTYPLRDLAIADVSTVAYNMRARIVISNSQQGVNYCLCDDKQQPIPSDVKQPDMKLLADGNGGDLELITPAIINDRSFSIKATKLNSGLFNFLLQTPIVKVGLDVTLVASIQHGELLVASAAPAANAARIVNYGVKIQVAVEKAQEGVDYQLRTMNDAELSASVRGNGGTIVLETTAIVTEDMDIRIRATKTFEKSEKKATQTDFLTTILPLKVRANPAVGVFVAKPIIDYSGTASIKIQGSQASTRYQVLTRSIADHEFIRGAVAGPVLSIAVPKQPTVVLPIPSMTGFAVATDAVQGKGGDLVLTCPNLTVDNFIALQAAKTHLDNNGAQVTSTVNVSQMAAVLVRPDANPALQFKASVADSLLQAPIQVSGGQAGVFYEFTTLGDGKVQGLPVYFHQLERADNTQNKGLGQLQIGVDMVISPALLPERVKANPNLAGLPPEQPELSADAGIKSDAELSIRAIKAQTRVEVIFKRTVSKLLA